MPVRGIDGANRLIINERWGNKQCRLQGLKFSISEYYSEASGWGATFLYAAISPHSLSAANDATPVARFSP